MSQTVSQHKTVGERAEEIYAQRLRSLVETDENIGKVIVIDVENGNYEIDADGLNAHKQLKTKYPDVNSGSLFAIRIGYDAMYAIGGAVTRTTGSGNYTEQRYEWHKDDDVQTIAAKIQAMRQTEEK